MCVDGTRIIWGEHVIWGSGLVRGTNQLSGNRGSHGRRRAGRPGNLGCQHRKEGRDRLPWPLLLREPDRQKLALPTRAPPFWCRHKPYFLFVPAATPAPPALLPILNILVPHTEHVPVVAGLPFFIVVSVGSFIGCLALHLTQ